MKKQQSVRQFNVAWVLFVVIVSFASCREKNRDCGAIPRLHFSFSDTVTKQSELFEVDEVIQLETSDNCLIGYMSTVIQRPSGFYIVANKQVVKFDSLGRALFNINKHGRGAEEFSDISAISVDRADKFLYLHDGVGQKVVCYDTRTGEYVRHFPLNYNAFTFSVLPDGKHFVFYCGPVPSKELKKGNRYPRFIVADSVGKVVNTFAYCDVKVSIPTMFAGKDVFASGDSVLYCFANYNDSIFSINDKLDVHSAYLLDYGNDNQARVDEFVKRLVAYTGTEPSSLVLKDPEIYWLNRFNFTKKHLFFMGSRDSKFFHIVYDKFRKQAINLNELKADVIGNNIYFMMADDQYFYIPLSVLALKSSIAEQPDGFDGKIINAVKDLNDDANPVIVRLKMK